MLVTRTRQVWLPMGALSGIMLPEPLPCTVKVLSVSGDWDSLMNRKLQSPGSSRMLAMYWPASGSMK